MDEVYFSESEFPFPDLLDNVYFKNYREEYCKRKETSFPIGRKNYVTLLRYLTEVDNYNPQHSRSFAKRFRCDATDRRNGEATFAELIVYQYYIRLVCEHLIQKIELNKSESDLIIIRRDGTQAYMEVFCIMPDFKEPDKPGKIVVINKRTHMQDALCSIRQKLLNKIKKQDQMTKPRDNYAVIELNDLSIANDFSVLSSLSSGYKINIDPSTCKVLSEGYDWKESVFDDEATRSLKAIIYFPLGLYDARKYIHNPRFMQKTEQSKPAQRDN